MASNTPLRPEHFADATLERFQRSIQIALRKILAFTQVSGVAVTQSFTSGQIVNVAHGLGRAYVGWYVIRTLPYSATAASASWLGFEVLSQPDPTKYIRLQSTNQGKYTFWVF